MYASVAEGGAGSIPLFCCLNNLRTIQQILTKLRLRSQSPKSVKKYQRTSRPWDKLKSHTMQTSLDEVCVHELQGLYFLVEEVKVQFMTQGHKNIKNHQKYL